MDRVTSRRNYPNLAVVASCVRDRGKFALFPSLRPLSSLLKLGQVNPELALGRMNFKW